VDGLVELESRENPLEECLQRFNLAWTAQVLECDNLVLEQEDQEGQGVGRQMSASSPAIISLKRAPISLWKAASSIVIS